MLMPALMLLGACSSQPVANNGSAEVDVPNMHGIEFTAGTWVRKDSAALYMSPEQDVLLAVRCDRAKGAIVFTLPGSIAASGGQVKIEADGASHSFPAVNAEVDGDDDALVEAAAPASMPFIRDTLGGNPQRIGAEVDGTPAFITPGDKMVGEVIKACL
ncbi:hypothetical protein [Sphingomonas sp. AOB5]|uniref:hypothetical protein n=1 Tax=Sphingomonas sp. AOB5 TaxID=3034017 RepID=UPI0023F82988|nr:hypothetical protein [Sphingomonas sp. AOB5]